MAFQQGNSLELAVALPLKNNKFTKGQYKSLLVNDSTVPVNQATITYDNAHLDGAEIHNHLQYGDEVTIISNSSKEIEHLIVAGIDKANSLIALRDKNNQVIFADGDSITAYCTGLAAGWEIPLASQAWIKAGGIKKGPISRQLTKSFTAGSGAGTYVKTGTNSGLNGLLTITQHAAEYGFALDLLSEQLEYIMSPLYLDSGISKFKVAINNPDGLSGAIDILLGQYHRGGWRKAFAQMLTIHLAQNNTTLDSTILKQSLVDFGDESGANKRRKSLLIPYQFYRIGGKVFVDPVSTNKIYNDDYNLKLILQPSDNLRDNSSETISADILDSIAGNVSKWYEFSQVGLLASGISNTSLPHLGIWLDNKITSAHSGDVNLYIDELWVEHAGGVNYADIDGCLKFSRYNVWPEQGSIQITPRDENSEIYGRKLLTIECQIDYCPQEFWDQLQTILEWQDRGYLLNFHPYIKDIGNVLTGKLTIKNLSKNSWDLSLRSFLLSFEEII